MSTATQTTVIEFDPDKKISGYCYPTLVRELTVEDFDQGEWRMEEYSSYHRDASAHLTLTMHKDVLQHIKKQTVCSEFPEGLFRAGYYTNDKENFHTVASVSREMSYKGVRKDKQPAKHAAALEEVNRAIAGEEGEKAIAKAVEDVNEIIRGWVNNQRRQYVLYGTNAVMEHKTPEMEEEAGLGPLNEQIEVLRAQLDGLYKARQKKWETYIRKDWEKDESYPQELREAVLKAIEEGKLHVGRRGPFII
jgi:hypothetical protein